MPDDEWTFFEAFITAIRGRGGRPPEDRRHSALHSHSECRRWRLTDLAVAHLAAAEHLLGGGNSVSVNLGTGKGSSVAEVVASVERVTGRRIATTSSPRRAGDPPQLVANPANAERILGWKAQRPTLDMAIADA